MTMTRSKTPSLTYRSATPDDVPMLAELNRQLIIDEGHRNRMSLAEIEERMRRWLWGEYEAIIFEADGRPLAYALYRIVPEYVYLRQLFVDREHRRQGIGRQAVDLLRTAVWPAGPPIRVEVLADNERARRFWQSVGFSDYAVTMELS